MYIRTKGITDEDFLNYKKPAMFIATTKCSFKCDKECGKDVCINSSLAKAPTLCIKSEEIVSRYVTNPITHAVVIGGLEPFDTFDDLYDLIQTFRLVTEDDIVIYTGYNENEIVDSISVLSNKFTNIILKCGRYRYDLPDRYDDVLGVTLASNNQYGIKIS